MSRPAFLVSSAGRRRPLLVTVTALALLSVPACRGGDARPPEGAGRDAGSGELDAGAEANGPGEDGEIDPPPHAGAGVGGNAAGPAANSGSGGTASEAGRSGSVVGGGSVAAGSGGSPAPVCPGATLRAGDFDESVMHGGIARQYLVHVPASYDGASAVPLVIDLHGWTYVNTDQANMSGWREKADAEGFIVAYPQGLDKSFNGGAVCCGTSQENEIDDRGFVRAVVESLQAKACIDRKRVYVTGLSNGGALAYLLACRDADVFAAAAPVSMGNGARPCTPSRPISMIMFRGTRDDLVPYEGSATYPSAAADVQEWRSLNACSAAAQRLSGVCDRYAECDGGSEVTLCTIPNGAHLLYADAARAGAAVADVAWAEFEQHVLP